MGTFRSKYMLKWFGSSSGRRFKNQKSSSQHHMTRDTFDRGPKSYYAVDFRAPDYCVFEVDFRELTQTATPWVW